MSTANFPSVQQQQQQHQQQQQQQQHCHVVNVF
jgi:hypothetical protein